jgi:hypothetical protein
MRDALIVPDSERKEMRILAMSILAALDATCDEWQTKATALTAALTLHAARGVPVIDKDAVIALQANLIRVVEQWISENGGTSATNQN